MKKVCGEKPPLEYLPVVYDTSPAEPEDLEQALLGEQEKAEVVLVGTSNSTRIDPSFANFVGHLKEYLSVEIDNYSIAGGSFRGAIGNYILGGKYSANKPRLLIWELSAHYGLDQKETFREIIPALYGSCSESNAVVSMEGELLEQEMTLFSDLAEKNMFSNRYYLYLEFENKGIRDFEIVFNHKKSDEKDRFDVERDKEDFPESNGEFFIELNSYIQEPLDSITMDLKKPRNVSGSYIARLCKVPSR